ncbi:MAG: hypothetical protein MUC36_19890 [Planctomycetes bacterium]|jgi:hypothetical protein|nr:hypothetical protein [Planctomycetota bacterium]
MQSFNLRPFLVSLSMLASAAVLAAQQTFVVNAGGGPGVNFTSLPPAIAAAADGDTIVVQTGPFGEGALPFTTNKGLTIVGQGGAVPIGTSPTQKIQIVGLPAGRSFRMVGFERGLSDGPIDIEVSNCAGAVHLETIVARENSFFPVTIPSITITNCASVTLREIVNFGSPAVRIDNSRVVLSRCELGRTRIGLGGGPCLVADSAQVDIVQPLFRTNGITSQPCVTATNSELRIVGDSAAVVSGGPVTNGGSALLVNGGSLVVDPAVAVVAGGSQPVYAGSTAPQFVPGDATWASAAAPGQNLTLTTRSEPSAVVVVALGAPGPLLPTALGLLGIDAAQPYAFASPAVIPAGGTTALVVAVPAALPRGSAFAAQAVVVTSTALRLGLPATFVLR